MMSSCYNPLINFVIFCVGMLLIGVGLFKALEKYDLKGVIMFIVGICILVGITCYFFYLQEHNIPICNG